MQNEPMEDAPKVEVEIESSEPKEGEDDISRRDMKDFFFKTGSKN